MSTDRLTVECRRCRGTQFRLPNDLPRPDDVITCGSCGASARYVDVQQAAIAAGKRVFEDALRGFGKITWR